MKTFRHEYLTALALIAQRALAGDSDPTRELEFNILAEHEGSCDLAKRDYLENANLISSCKWWTDFVNQVAPQSFPRWYGFQVSSHPSPGSDQIFSSYGHSYWLVPIL